MSNPLAILQERNPEQVRAVLNLLVETPYFFREDDEELFIFLRRHRNEFLKFYEQYYDWSLVMDSKCARVYKPRWYNDNITEPNRDIFDFRRRDECLGFMMLLEFFEQQLEENSMTIEDRENLKFRFGNLLEFEYRRFMELFPGEEGRKYTEEYVRANVLRRIMPVLEKYRFVNRLPPPEDVEIKEPEMIFEALPPLYHYSAGHLGEIVQDLVPPDMDE